jgi:hypothetical protein
LLYALRRSSLERYVIRTLALAGMSLLVLAACSPKAGQPASNDPAAGLSAEIGAWHKDLEASHPACASKVEGKGCQDFQVMCKAYQEISPDEAARGVTSQVVAAMTFAGRNADGSTGRSGSAFALFSKTRDGWTRAEAMPVNLQSCAPL